MSGRPGSSERIPLSTPAPSNPNGVSATQAGGGMAPKPDINPPHLPTATVPHLPLVPQLQQAQAGKIPPLMGIQPNPQLSLLPSTSHVAPQPVSNPVSIAPPVGMPQSVASGATNPSRHVVTGGKGPQPNVSPGGLKPRGTETGGKQMKGKEDDKGYVIVVF